MRIEDAYAKLDEAARLAAARGSLIFHIDLATEQARAAFARRGIPEEALAVVADETGYRVFAFQTPAGRVIAEAQFDDAGEVILVSAPAAPPPRAGTLAQARRTIIADAALNVENRAVLVVPASDPRQPIEAYALAVAETPDDMRVADHWLVTLDSAGRRIESRQAIDASIDPAAIDVRSRRPIRLDDAGATPNELHIYLSLKHSLPLSVETRESGLVWRVDGERVSRG